MITFILLFILIALLITWVIILKKDFYSFKAVTVLTFALVIGVYMVGYIMATIIYTAIGLAITITNISLIKHEGFNAKRLIGVQIVIAGMIAFLFAKVPVLNGLFCFMECNLFGYLIMAYLAVKRKPAYDKDYVIILGCLISKNGGLLPLLKARTNKAIHFAWDQEIATGKMVKYVPSGGQGKNEVISEGSAMEFYLLTHGAENYEIFAEKKSRNTYENMLFSKEIIDKNLDNAKVAFATTNFHVYRSGILAKKVGLNAEGISSSTKWYFWPAAVIREYIAYGKMFAIKSIVACLVTAVGSYLLTLL